VKSVLIGFADKSTGIHLFSTRTFYGFPIYEGLRDWN